MEEYGFQENKSKGYIKLYRSFMKWRWYDDIKTRGLFIHCLLRANYENVNWHEYDIERGSFITSYQKLANENGLTIRQVRTILNRLKKTGEIDYIATNFQHTKIKILNYNEYQVNDNLKNDNDEIQSEEEQEQTTDKQSTNNRQASASERQAGDIQPPINNKDKKGNKDNKENKFNAKKLFLNFFDDGSSEFKENEHLKEVFLSWLEYKSAIKHQYKTEKGIKTAFKDLIKFSKNDADSAKQLVEYAISREWRGIYEMPKSAKKIQSVSDNQPKTDWESRLM